MKTPEEVARDILERWARIKIIAIDVPSRLGPLMREFTLSVPPTAYEDIAAAIADERARADALAEALRIALNQWRGYMIEAGNEEASVVGDDGEEISVAGPSIEKQIYDRCVAALATYNSAAGGSGHRAALPAQESPAGGDFPPTTGRAGD